MAGQQDDQDKQHEATQKKLDDARKKGEIPRSSDLSTAASYAGMLVVFAALGAGSVSQIGTAFGNLIGQADTYAPLFFDGSARPVAGGLMGYLLKPLSPWFLVPGLAALLAILGQRGLVFAPEKLKPKLSRISILANAKNKFGRSGLFEFSKSMTKLTIYSVVLWLFLLGKMSEILRTTHLSAGMASRTLASLAMEFLAIVLAISIVIGAADFLWQYHEHKRRNRMSHKELRDEHKAQEGDPHMKQQRRQKGFDIAMNQMLADVPDANVVIVNPQHYAVALKWDRMSGRAPVCVAKGVDEIAARIREAAQEAGVPLHRDPPTARALHATIDIGQEVLPDQYKAVAAAIRFAESMRAKVRGQRPYRG